METVLKTSASDSMDATYYIPVIYEEDSGSSDPVDLMKARAECLISFHCVHPDAILILGPIFTMVEEDEENT